MIGTCYYMVLDQIQPCPAIQTGGHPMNEKKINQDIYYAYGSINGEVTYD